MEGIWRSVGQFGRISLSVFVCSHGFKGFLVKIAIRPITSPLNNPSSFVFIFLKSSFITQVCLGVYNMWVCAHCGGVVWRILRVPAWKPYVFSYNRCATALGPTIVARYRIVCLCVCVCTRACMWSKTACYFHSEVSGEFSYKRHK